jgi:hypothetical protein
MDRNPRAREIVKAFDKQQQVTDRVHALGAGAKQPPFDMSFLATLGPAITLTNFRNEMSAFLKAKGLDAAICDDNGNWSVFVRYYGEVIKDCPLHCVNHGLTHVDEVVVDIQTLDPTENPQFAPFTVSLIWRWKSKITGGSWFNPQSY